MNENRPHYKTLFVLFLLVSSIFSVLGGMQAMFAFWAVIAIPLTVLLVVAAGEQVVLGVRYALGQLAVKRKGKHHE